MILFHWSRFVPTLWGHTSHSMVRWSTLIFVDSAGLLRVREGRFKLVPFVINLGKSAERVGRCACLLRTVCAKRRAS